jgi:hypothetical protein
MMLNFSPPILYDISPLSAKAGTSGYQAKRWMWGERMTFLFLAWTQ